MSHTRSDSQSKQEDSIEFYVPATFQFSPEPGRIERILVGLFHDREQAALEARIVTEEPTKEFYTPAMYQFSTAPGRIERFLNAVSAERSEQTAKTVPESFVDVFYLPAVDPDTFRQRERLDDVPVRPASDVLQGEGRPPEPSS